MTAVSGVPQLTEADVRRWIGDESFRRGQRYFDQDAILNPRRAGMILKAQCQGSRSQPYRVQITLGPKGIVSGDCSCPVGGGGHCKHAAALLLTWLDDADAFVDVEDIATTLDRHSKAELIDLICTRSSTDAWGDWANACPQKVTRRNVRPSCALCSTPTLGM